jgi:hypothetical protein
MLKTRRRWLFIIESFHIDMIEEPAGTGDDDFNTGRNLGVKLKCVKFHKILLSLFGGKNVMQCGGYKDAVFVRVQLLLMCSTVTALGKACQGN